MRGQFSSFQLGTVSVASCLSVSLSVACLSVRAINRWTSARAARHQTAQREMLYVQTVYPAESWAPRERGHEQPNIFALCSQKAIHLHPGENGELSGRLEVGQGKSGMLENKSGNICETRKDRGKVTRDGLQKLTNALSDGTIGTKAHKIQGKVGVSVVRGPENYQSTHIQGALRGYLCDSAAFLYLKLDICFRIRRTFCSVRMIP